MKVRYTLNSSFHSISLGALISRLGTSDIFLSYVVTFDKNNKHNTSAIKEIYTTFLFKALVDIIIPV